MIIGFSTGDLYTKSPQEIKRGLDNFKKIGCNAVEIGGWSIMDSPFLDKIAKEDFDGFEYISFHAPGGPYKKDSKTKNFLDKIEEINSKTSLDCVVFHPNEIEDKTVFNNYSFPVGLENMDRRKPLGKTVENMKEILENTNFSFVLDLNHVFTNNKNLSEINDFYKEFKNRIKEIHLSGVKKTHAPLYLTKQEEIINAIPDKNIPIIIESFRNPYLDLVAAQKELNYILERV